MKKIVWGVLLIFTLTFQAQEAKVVLESWRIGADYVIFVNLKNKGMKINKGCEEIQSHCQVWAVLAEVSTKELGPSDLSGGKNIGASLCHKQENAQVLFARSAKGRQATFCLFSDGSMVDSGGLLLAAKMNDAKKDAKKDDKKGGRL